MVADAQEIDAKDEEEEGEAAYDKYGVEKRHVAKS